MTSHERLEAELRNALRCEEAPPHFAEHVLARASRQSAPAGLWNRLLSAVPAPALRFATAAVLLLATLGSLVEYRHHQQELREGAAAKQQLLLALRITGTKLQYVQAKVSEAGAQRFGSEHDRGER